MIFFLLILGCPSPSDTSQPESEEPENEEVDESVIIIGGGASGLAAGIRLLELGIEPLILEKESTLGGAGIHAGRFFGVDTQWQSRQNIEDSVDLALNDWQNITGESPDHNVEQFIVQSNVVLDWITSFDVEFDGVESDIGAGSLPRVHSLSSDSPHPLALWSQMLAPYSVTNSPVLSIVKEDNHFVIETNSQKYTATHIILATGGFARNETIVLEYNPDIANHNWHTEAWFGMVGDGVSWLNRLSIPLHNMEHVGLYAHGVTDVYLDHPEIMIVPALERALILNQDGERIFNEQYTQSLQGGQIMLSEDKLFAIFDAPLWEGTTLQGLGYNYDSPPILSGSDYKEAGGVVVQQNDVRDLAMELNLDVATTMNSISTYNTGIQQQNDAFGKNIPHMMPIQTPPFYAIELQLSTGKSFGGASTNNWGQSEDPNVYVIGESAGFLGSPSVGWGFSGSITACYYLGKQAAEDIAERYPSR